ncbi:MAG: alkaline phosphatase [Alistipes sp.]|jgi:alkaline phosphatase|nr:alkaline phosphatase [Alistipes sp.]
MKRLILILTSFAVTVSVSGCDEKDRPSSSPRVKNVILMVGDGMGLTQVSTLMLAENYAPVNFERASVSGFVKTYSANNRVTDSAAGATAYSTGQKTNNGHLGVNPAGEPLETILEKAETKGLATGLVATTIIQHATPGAFYAHTPKRNDFEAISLDLLDAGIEVAIGGGMNYLRERADGRNLAAELEEQGYLMVDSLAALDGVTDGQVMALVDAGFDYIANGRDPEYLPRATIKALDILTADTPRAAGGFFLMVEGSMIDYTCHDNNAAAMIDEIREFDDAVGIAFDYADSHPGTLVIVLADHETGGLTLPSAEENFLLAESGVEPRWSTTGHTATMVPMFAYGAHAGLFGGVIDNTEVNQRLVELLGLK